MTRMISEELRALLKVYFIMGSMNCSRPPSAVLREAIAGGITLFQFREKGPGALTGTARVELARELQQICQRGGVPFIVNDDLELALTLDADGIHVGQDDAPALEIRQRFGSGKIIGVSAHSLAEARRAIADGADYLGVGPVYPTISKDDAQAVRGTAVIEELRAHGIAHPLVGIGGITAANAFPVIQAGADGISVISAMAAAADARAAARELAQVTD
ncbi:thiamine-phosphate synthase [Paenibacillus albidus]|uniref:Thiamine-phosphate synthase n=1 Tax=Paenibacillus albidus TaxID=2041023 RepID=A0A917CD57_9BACL|nr:thiamine phosphate synthase [Paenibacillus albidus]GGF84408.1 thiamine-phosphate synthase [Paenibacillus albidus]